MNDDSCNWSHADGFKGSDGNRKDVEYDSKMAVDKPWPLWTPILAMRKKVINMNSTLICLAMQFMMTMTLEISRTKTKFHAWFELRHWWLCTNSHLHIRKGGWHGGLPNCAHLELKISNDLDDLFGCINSCQEWSEASMIISVNVRKQWWMEMTHKIVSMFIYTMIMSMAVVCGAGKWSNSSLRYIWKKEKGNLVTLRAWCWRIPRHPRKSAI